MKLRKLIVNGFKSFADRTEFEFDDGVSCVVGPNGCGKSNVVDAIKWVLGEQSAKSLRGSEMLDVVFNGSSARRPSSSAAVTLEFDNADGMLQPLINGEVQEAETVSVTRRLYRSGQSEYLINKQPARLRDIREMFLDTGLGGSSYSIIEQGRVAQFLQASQEQRRAFFDEAAGISRYKQRKKEALRKLDRVEQNLLRLQDILAEVEKRLRSIKYQAGKARNYQTYSEQLNELKSLFYLSRFHVMDAKRSKQQERLDAAGEALRELQQALAGQETEQQTAEAKTSELERQSRDLQASIATLSSQITSLRQRAEMQTARVTELDEQIQINEKRIEEVFARTEQIEADLNARQSETRIVQQDVEVLQTKCDEMRDKMAQAEMDAATLTGGLEEHRTAAADASRQLSRLENDLHAMGLKRQSLQAESQNLTEKLQGIDAQLGELTERQAVQQASQKEAETLAAQRSEALGALRTQAEGLDNAEKDLSRQLNEAREARSRLHGRIHTLEEMQQRYEGAAESIRNVAQAMQDGQLDCLRGMIGDLVQTDVEHAPVVEAALAEAQSLFVAERFSDVQAASGKLEELLGENGSVEILCMDLLAAAPSDDMAVLTPMIVARLMDQVSFPDWLEPAIWRLLGRTFVVRSLDDARAAAGAMPHGYRFVTLAGEVLEPDGRVRLGSAKQSAGRIARQSELNELGAQRAELDVSIESLQGRCDTTQQQRETIDEQIESLQAQLHEANYERTQCGKQLAELEKQLDTLRRQQPELQRRQTDLQKQLETSDAHEKEAKDAAEKCRQMREDHDERIESLQNQLKTHQQHQAELNEKRTEQRVSLSSAEQKLLAAREAVTALEHQKQQRSRDLQNLQAAIDMDRQRQADAREEIQTSGEKAEQLQTQQDALDAQAVEVEETRNSIAEKHRALRVQLTEQREKVEASSAKVSDLRIELTELTAHLDDLLTRAWDDMQMDLRELHGNYEHDEERDWAAVEMEIEDLRGKIKRLGNVNLDAIAEQDELEQRHDYLAGQLTDIEDAQKQLENLIDKLNVECQTRFAQTFSTVRENFQVLFRKLFGGGKADVILENPDDVLESNIDIVARPPGKELRSISLLSGGEKTMAALAMIFSFFQARPSPFCLLDEVDAALDEANTERYNAMVLEFLNETQFIMISHAKRTMSMANILYGVTMQEPGVSKRVSVKFEEAAEMAEAG